MASIDKIYATYKNYIIFKCWLEENNDKAIEDINENILGRLYKHEPYTKTKSISCFSERIDRWLFENCNINFVLQTIKEQYNGEPLLLEILDKIDQLETERNNELRKVDNKYDLLIKKLINQQKIM